MIGNQGYIAIKKQSAATTAVIPDVFGMLYEETLTTNLNVDEDNAIAGSKWARIQVLPGQRGHVGDITVLAEPNSSHLFWDMAGVPMTVAGSNPSTWSGEIANDTEGGSYTVDISNGSYVSRYIGVQASSIGPDYDANKMRWRLSLGALRAFHGAKVATINTTTVTLSDDYDPAPTTGLVAGDVVKLVTSAGVATNYTIDSITNGTTLELTASAASNSPGDSLVLRPRSVDLTDIVTPFLWSRTEWRYGADAATALSATHTPVEPDSSWTFNYPFSEDEGDKRSGSIDPAALLRTNPDFEITARKYFTGPTELQNFNGISKTALVIRCFSGDDHEFRLTLNNLRPRGGGDKPLISSGEVSYYELPYVPAMDLTDGQPFDVKVLNGVAS